MEAGIASQDQLQAARNRVETYARSLFQIHGLPSPGDDEVGNLVSRAIAGMSPHQLRHPDSISTSAIGQIDQLVLAASEAKRRPQNLYSAEGARLAQSGEGIGKGGIKGMDALDRARMLPSGARYNDLPAGDGTGGSYANDRSIAGASSEFVRAFAGAGVSRDVIKNFAAVGLDRAVFDQFRHEGYSTAQIADNAKDMKVLNFRGKDDAEVSMHASTTLRKAVVAAEKYGTPQTQAAEAAEMQRINALPDGDPRKARDLQFVERTLQRSKNLDRHKGLGTGAQQRDEHGLQADIAKSGTALQKSEDRQVANFKKLEVASLNRNDQDDWGSTAVDTKKAPAPKTTGGEPTKPAPSKMAETKSAAAPKPAKFMDGTGPASLRFCGSGRALTFSIGRTTTRRPAFSRLSGLELDNRITRIVR